MITDGQFSELSPRSVAEEEVLATLTDNGSVPIEWAFAYRDMPGRWSPKMGDAVLLTQDDDSLHLACLAYLKERGQGFETWDDVLVWGEDHQWPNLDRFRQFVNRKKNPK